ncbi:hypothetical protein BDD43_1188 [Mucilaginibacter gracilis]|uniref:Uncharacterized protein n=2 Tax=Mucilaginibacter TaxID=423349 RepID=H1YHS8_9SPHI|nr:MULTISPECIES: hypothetical protein [Mucilaginibacter]EHQ27478.1 hypothetical protein Mucpa_3379 [Mucilaginibacter paludis DSM 18603]RKR81045.1 hypothetical protein BDD43_1188 [Mucilaginibacter gracilis]
MKPFNSPETLIPLGVVIAFLLVLVVKRYHKAEKEYDDDFQGWI